MLVAEQRGVLRGIVIGVGVTVVSLVVVVTIQSLMFSVDLSSAERIKFALQADLALALWLAFSIGRLARHRFFTAEDIDGGGLSNGTEQAWILQATLQNTLEQTVLAVLVHIIWAVMMPQTWLSALPVAVSMFIIGRVLFVRGYRRGASARALGFALTFYPSVLMLIAIVIKALSGLFG